MRLNQPSELNPMPEYQVFPIGSWHLLAAIMLMIVAIASTLVLLSDLFDLWMSSESVLYLYVALLVILTLMLVIPTAGLIRGRAKGHGFLLAYNLALCVTLAVGIIVALVNESSTSAAIYGCGLVFGLLARKLYRSAALARCVEHFRIIWTIHRARRGARRGLD